MLIPISSMSIIFQSVVIWFHCLVSLFHRRNVKFVSPVGSCCMHKWNSSLFNDFKGCGMGPWLALVSLCFRENGDATCKIGSFLFSLDNSPQKNVIVLFLEIKFQNGAHLKKGLFLTYFSHFLVTREKLQKFLQHISETHTYTYFAHPIDFFLPYQFWKKIRIYQIRFLFSMSPGVDSYSHHFGTINK